METTVERTPSSRARMARSALLRLRQSAGSRQLSGLLGTGDDEPGNPTTYRAMDLALRIGELLLGSGESTENVTDVMLGIANAYGLPHTEATINFTGISLSCLPGQGAAPVTGERVVRRRNPDYARLIATHALAREVAAGQLDLDEAFERLRTIKRTGSRYPRWLRILALPLMAGCAGVLAGGGLLVAVLAFVTALVAEQTAWYFAGKGVAEFYQNAIAAAIAASAAVVLIILEVPVQSSAVITAALMILLPGRPLVASVQDGITGAFVSSGARLLEVFYIVAAVVGGVATVVYAAVHFGLPIAAAAPPVATNGISPAPILAAIGLTVTFALSLSVPLKELVFSVFSGGLVWVISAMLLNVEFSPVAAAAVAAAVAGFFAHLMAWWRKRPALPYIVPLIGPLLPGSALYRGLLEFGGGNAQQGLLFISQALAIGFALAAGISVSGEIVRAMRGQEFRSGAFRRRRQAANRTRGY